MRKTRTSRLPATATSAALLAILAGCSGTSGSTTAASSTAGSSPSASPTVDAPTVDATDPGETPPAAASASAAIIAACQKAAGAYSAFQSGYDPSSSLPKQALAAATAGVAYAQIALTVIENAGGSNLDTATGTQDQTLNKEVAAVSTDFENIYGDFKNSDEQSGAALISGQLQTDLNAMTSTCQPLS